MQKYDSIVKRIQAYEDKCCAAYQKSDGPLFKYLRAICLVVAIYSLCTTLLFIGNIEMHKTAGDTNKYVEDFQITQLWICVALLVLSFVALFWKKIAVKICGAVVGMASLPFSLYVFAVPNTDKLNGFLGYDAEYFYRHFIPAAIMIIFFLWMLVLAVREVIITNKRYRKIEENIYQNYRETFKNKKDFVVTNEMWEEYIKNYDPRAFKDLDK